MTVAELIRALRKLDQSADVFVRDDAWLDDAWLGELERVEVDSDGFVIICCVECDDTGEEGVDQDEDDDSDDEGEGIDGDDSDDEEDDACD